MEGGDAEQTLERRQQVAGQVVEFDPGSQDHGGKEGDVPVGLYEYGGIIDELEAARKALESIGTKGKLPQLQAQTTRNIRKLEKLLDCGLYLSFIRPPVPGDPFFHLQRGVATHRRAQGCH